MSFHKKFAVSFRAALDLYCDCGFFLRAARVGRAAPAPTYKISSKIGTTPRVSVRCRCMHRDLWALGHDEKRSPRKKLVSVAFVSLQAAAYRSLCLRICGPQIISRSYRL